MADPSADAIVAALPIVDAHHHVWDLALKAHPWLVGAPLASFRYGDYSALRRCYLPADYRRDTARFNVVKTVYVEAEWDRRDPIGETRWMHDIAAREGLPHAMVAQVWLDRADAAQVLAEQAAFPLVRSVRHKPKSAARPQDAKRGAPGSMDCPRWREGFALLARHGLHFDLQTPWWHLDAAAELARDFPATTIILNHTGLPADRSPEGLAGWRSAMQLLAREANVAVKIWALVCRGGAGRWNCRARSCAMPSPSSGRSGGCSLPTIRSIPWWPRSTKSTAASWKSHATCRKPRAAGSSTTMRLRIYRL